MLGKLAVLCLCLAVASAKPARKQRFDLSHFGLVKTCDTDEIVSAAQSIAEQTSTFAEELIEELYQLKTDVALCSNPLDILECATKGMEGIVKSALAIVADAKAYSSNMSTEVPALIADIQACL